MMKRSKTYFRLSAVACTILLGTGACSPTITQHGNMLEDYQVEEVVPQIHSRTDVLRILGSPTTQATFDPSLWYYIGQKKEKRGILDPEVIEERVVLVAFNDEGIVERVEEIERDRINVAITDSKTPTHGNEQSLMQEFFGNLGRFNPPTAGQ